MTSQTDHESTRYALSMPPVSKTKLFVFAHQTALSRRNVGGSRSSPRKQWAGRQNCIFLPDFSKNIPSDMLDLDGQ